MEQNHQVENFFILQEMDELLHFDFLYFIYYLENRISSTLDYSYLHHHPPCYCHKMKLRVGVNAWPFPLRFLRLSESIQ